MKIPKNYVILYMLFFSFHIFAPLFFSEKDIDFQIILCRISEAFLLISVGIIIAILYVRFQNK